MYFKLCPSGSRPGILYGLPKVHKPCIDNYPAYRPILSAIGTPSYKLSKVLVPILSSMTSNKYTTKDILDHRALFPSDLSPSPCVKVRSPGNKVLGDKTPLVFFGSLPLYSFLRIYRYNYFIMLTFFCIYRNLCKLFTKAK